MIYKKVKFSLVLFLVAIISVFSVNVYKVKANSETIYLGGIPAGFSLNTRGATVVGLCDVITNDGLVSPSKNSGINVGDIILYIDDNEINNAFDIEKSLSNANSKIITISRENELLIKTITPAIDMSGNNKLGVFVRDDVSGIGTITFIKGNRFASLGHPVLDDNGNLLEIIGGNLYSCNITGCVKGERGKAGELRGVFVRNNFVAKIEKNLQVGVFGKINNDFDKENLTKIDIGQAKMGDATIYSTIEGKTPKQYNISIIKVDNNVETKNFVVKITDEELISKTGGIVQGMSGSPIVQNGKLVGAVTHVFINDPTRGFGISIENMINN